MYNDYFGLREAPFSIAPNPQYLYMSDRHREALAHLMYGIQSDGGFILLTGEVGTGKTTVCRCLLQQIPQDVDTAFVLNPKLTALELLATVCDELGIEYPEDATIKVLVDRLNDFLLTSHQEGRKTVLIIDEAQNLSVDVLEQLRLLTNLETNQRKLLQIILLGQPELLTVLARQELRQLSQRVTARFHLDALNAHEVGDYIQHRLEVAGAKGNLFPQAAQKRIYKISGGIPRLINLICDRALLGTYVQNKLSVDPKTVEAAAKEILGDQSKRQSKSSQTSIMPYLTGAMAATLVVAGGFGVYYYNNQSKLADSGVPAVAIESQRTAEPNHSTPISSTNTAPSTAQTNVEMSPAMQPMVSEPTMAPLAVVTQPIPEPANIEFDQLDRVTGYGSERDAFVDLFKLWGTELVLAPDTDPCVIADSIGLQCLTRLGSLRDIAHLNRPVLTQLGEDWLVISAYEPGAITLDTPEGSKVVRESEFLRTWQGNFTLLWRMPPNYLLPTKLGDTGATVDWLVQQVSIMDEQPTPERTGHVFDTDMEQRIKRFQISVGLVPDGIVGAQTWIHLNSVEGTDIPFIQPPSDSTRG